MTVAQEPLDPALLRVLTDLGIDPHAPASAADWPVLLRRLSALLKERARPPEASARGFGAPPGDAEAVFEAFLSTMSHELRTPVAVVLGCLELLGSGSAAEAERRNTVGTARRAALDLIQTIDAILDYCRIEAGELGIVRRPFDVEALVADVLGRHQGQADARGIALELRSDTRLPRRLAGDAHRLEQVLEGLLDNALKFTREGSVRVALSLEASQGQERVVRFSVSDTGPGIPRAALDQIFAPFQQLDASPSRRYGGIGLGLSLARKLVDALGGQLEVSSAPGRGSTFSFALPFAVAFEQPTVPRRSRICQRAHPRVLLAEDNEFNRTFIARSLELIGCEVRAVANGRIALDTLSEFEPDLVLLDVQMPEVDGLTAARRIRSLGEPLASVPIVALTANSQPAHRVQCEDAGMDELLAKPVNLESLRELCGRWVRAPEESSDEDGAPATQPVPQDLVAAGSVSRDPVSARRSATAVPVPSSQVARASSSPPSSASASEAVTSLLTELVTDAAGVLDLSRLEEIVQQAGDLGMLRELSEIFLEDMGVRIAGLSEAYLAGKEDEVRRLAHAVKGSSANFGAIEMAQYAERLELDPPSEAQRADLTSLEQAFVEVRRALRGVVSLAADDVACAK